MSENTHFLIRDISRSTNLPAKILRKRFASDTDSWRRVKAVSKNDLLRFLVVASNQSNGIDPIVAWLSSHVYELDKQVSLSKEKARNFRSIAIDLKKQLEKKDGDLTDVQNESRSQLSDALMRTLDVTEKMASQEPQQILHAGSNNESTNNDNNKFPRIEMPGIGAVPVPAVVVYLIALVVTGAAGYFISDYNARAALSLNALVSETQQKHINEIEDRIDSAEKSAELKEGRIQIQEQRLEELSDSLDEKSHEIAFERGKIDALEVAKDATQANLDLALEQIQRYEDGAKILRDQRDGISAQLENQKSITADLRAVIIAKDEQISIIRDELAKVKNALGASSANEAQPQAD